MKYYIFCTDVGQFRSIKEYFTRSLEYADVYETEAGAKSTIHWARAGLEIDVVVDENAAIIRETMLS